MTGQSQLAVLLPDSSLGFGLLWCRANQAIAISSLGRPEQRQCTLKRPYDFFVMLLPLGHLFFGDIDKPLSCLQTLHRSLIVVSRGSRRPYLKILGKALRLFENFSLLLVRFDQRLFVPRLEIIPIKGPKNAGTIGRQPAVMLLLGLGRLDPWLARPVKVQHGSLVLGILLRPIDGEAVRAVR